MLLGLVAQEQPVPPAPPCLLSGGSIPARMRSRVVLPAPARPRTTTREPRSTARSTSVKTSSEPNDFDSPVAVRGIRPRGEGPGKRSRPRGPSAAAPPGLEQLRGPGGPCSVPRWPWSPWSACGRLGIRGCAERPRKCGRTLPAHHRGGLLTCRAVDDATASEPSSWDRIRTSRPDSTKRDIRQAAARTRQAAQVPGQLHRG